MRWKIVVAGPAARMLADKVPEAVAAAVIEFMNGPLSTEPKRAGRPLRGELTGLWAARRGPWRVAYAIDDDTRTVTVHDVDHRGRVYRTR